MTRDKRLKRCLDEIRKAAGPDHMIDGRRSTEAYWKLAPYELRQKVLENVGWDSGGWIFHNWKELPEQMQFDLYHGFRHEAGLE